MEGGEKWCPGAGMRADWRSHTLRGNENIYSFMYIYSVPKFFCHFFLDMHQYQRLGRVDVVGYRVS